MLFQGKYRFLSNFFIEPDGTHVEREYQAMKFSDPEIASMFRVLSPGEAKRFAEQLTLLGHRDPDFPKNKIPIMEKLVLQKFTDHYDLANALIQVDSEIVETNTWHDNFWGVCHCQKCSNEPKLNHLGKIHERVRLHLMHWSPANSFQIWCKRCNSQLHTTAKHDEMLTAIESFRLKSVV